MEIANYISQNGYRHFYHNILDDNQKKAYDTILQGLLSYENEIKCENCSSKHISLIYHSLVYDIPELFFVDRFRYSHNDRDMTLIFYPEYNLPKEKTLQYLQKLDEEYSPFIERLRSFSDLEKEKAIHDLLSSFVEYDLKFHKELPYEAIGALLHKKAVCAGISKGFKYLADRLDLPCVVATGKTKNAGPNSPGHAWNIVQIDGHFFHVDATFDITISNCDTIRYDYFNLSDEEILKGRNFRYRFPKCDSYMNFYKLLGLYFANKAQLLDYIRSGCRQARKFTFKLPDIREKERVSEYIGNLFSENYPYKAMDCKTLSRSFNEEHMVFEFCLQ